MADQKLSELTAASTLTGAELVYVVQGGVSKRASVSSLLNRVVWPMGHGDVAVEISGSSSVVSNGTESTAAWFSFDKSLYDVAMIDMVAIDTSNPANHTIGHYICIVEGPDHTSTHEVDTGLHVDGTNTLTIPPADIVGNTVSLRFQRQSSSDATINTRYLVHLWKHYD